MPLENDIQELTKAVLALTYALNQHLVTSSRVVVREPTFTPDVTEKIKEREQEIIKEEIADSKKSKPTTDTSPPSEPESAPVIYDDVRKLIIAIGKESKDKAVAALSRLGVANGKELKEAQWPEAVAYLTRVAAGEVNPEESHA